MCISYQNIILLRLVTKLQKFHTPSFIAKIDMMCISFLVIPEDMRARSSRNMYVKDIKFKTLEIFAYMNSTIR